MNEPAALPLVSIITICFNNASDIEATIVSVLSQTYPNVEYIIIDGGSTDGTVSIIKKFESKLKYWVSENDRGISHAFNKGLAAATGEITGLINASDMYEPGAIEAAVAALKEADVVYGDLKYLTGGVSFYIQKGDHRYLPQEMTVNHPTVFVKQQWYKLYGGFNERFRCAMDYDVMLRLFVNGARFKNTNTVLASMNQNGLSDTQWLLGCKETLQIKNHYFPRHRLKNVLYFVKHVIAIFITKFLKRAGLGKLLTYYQTGFAKLRKQHYSLW